MAGATSPQVEPRAIVAQLQAQLSRHQRDPRDATYVVSSGLPELDARLPERGFPRGSLIEWLVPGPGSGAGTLALAAAREACRDGPPLVVVDRSGRFYPPAAAALGLDLARVLIVRPRRSDDEAWACDQALRTRGIGAVLAWPDRADARWLRRWQLAVEQSGVIGLFVRPERARGEPCFSAVRLQVQPLAGHGCRRVQLEIVRGRQGQSGTTMEVEFDHAARRGSEGGKAES
jgi:protein ImuA